MATFQLIQLMLLVLGAMGKTPPCKRLVCVYSNWSHYRPPSIGKFLIEHLDPGLCTHIIYSYMAIRRKKLETVEEYDPKMMYQVSQLKKANSELKTLVSIGGWGSGSKGYVEMVASKASRRSVIKSILKNIQKYNLDGIDLAWQYPGSGTSTPADRYRFTDFVAELKDEFVKYHSLTKRPMYLLSLTLPGGKYYIDNGFEIKKLATYADMLNIMTFDYYGGWDEVTNHFAPLYAKPGAKYDPLNVDFTAKYYVYGGAPKEKMNIGLVTYGSSFLLRSPDRNEIGDPAQGFGNQGPFTYEKGFMSYYEICRLINSGAKPKYDEKQKIPYVVKGRLWVGYENSESLAYKVAYTRKEGYGGVVVWYLDTDDFKNAICNYGTFPLIRSIKKSCEADLENDAIFTRATTEKTPEYMTPKMGTYDAPSDPNSLKNMCQEKKLPNSKFADPVNCRGYVWCSSGETYRLKCPKKLAYSPEKSKCVPASYVKGCN